ncbi:NUDIX hydrolase [Ornithinimicrobium cerasi]|uniref:NUDIX hydrolase n=1 Tax=Ornithinimicrobium cerasi TaxID=2248773 RepID=UPI000EFEA426|nr:NUDIX domain-containing protein [Ornithinimicrobium cerasi]
MDWATLRRKAGTAALVGFRVMPGPLKRAAVRVGAPTFTAGAVCILEHDGAVLFLWQPHREGWSLPGGLMGRGEEAADAVRREVAEEIGLEIDPGDPVTVNVDVRRQGVDVVFRVVLDRRPGLELATEARKARWFTPEELEDADRDTFGIMASLAALEGPRRPGRLLGAADRG